MHFENLDPVDILNLHKISFPTVYNMSLSKFFPQMTLFWRNSTGLIMNLEFGRYLKCARQFEMPNFLDGCNIHKYLRGFKMNKRSY